MFSSTLPSTLEEQIAQIYGKFQTNGAILVTRVPCQQQEGMVDCGLFSIATAYHRARGDNPGRLRLDQSQMRQHLLRCFEAQALAPFPTLEAGQSTTVSTKNTFSFIYTAHVRCQRATIQEWFSVMTVTPGIILSA